MAQEIRFKQITAIAYAEGPSRLFGLDQEGRIWSCKPFDEGDDGWECLDCPVVGGIDSLVADEQKAGA